LSVAINVTLLAKETLQNLLGIMLLYVLFAIILSSGLITAAYFLVFRPSETPPNTASEPVTDAIVSSGIEPPTEQPLSEKEQLLEVARALDEKQAPKSPKPNEPAA
jgi:hypothetical protein